jgi:hypothetical protein
MLIIRHEQMAALRQEHLRRVLAPEVAAYLVECGLVTLASKAPSPDTADADDALGAAADTADDGAEEHEPTVADLDALADLVFADLLSADAAGIESLDGLNQIASYRFELGGDWREAPAVHAILADSMLSEDEKLARLHRALTTG